jgi:hypothetical protein
MRRGPRERIKTGVRFKNAGRHAQRSWGLQDSTKLDSSNFVAVETTRRRAIGVGPSLSRLQSFPPQSCPPAHSLSEHRVRNGFTERLSTFHGCVVQHRVGAHARRACAARAGKRATIHRPRSQSRSPSFVALSLYPSLQVCVLSRVHTKPASLSTRSDGCQGSSRTSMVAWQVRQPHQHQHQH